MRAHSIRGTGPSHERPQAVIEWIARLDAESRHQQARCDAVETENRALREYAKRLEKELAAKAGTLRAKRRLGKRMKRILARQKRCPLAKELLLEIRRG
jgi:hypothetical protein